MVYIYSMALKLCSIASGSKGNCIYVASSNTELVIDLGISCTRANKAVGLLSGNKVQNILLTHTHVDHYSGVETALKQGATLYYNRICREHIPNRVGNMVETSGRFDVGDISVVPFKVSHDVPCVGYTLKNGNSKISVVTDLGYLPSECMDIIKGSGMVVLESNYDEQTLLSNTHYPAWLKNRIQGTHGHMSNRWAANAVTELVRSNVTNIMLAHLSEHNNTPELALAESKNALERVGLVDRAFISIAEQHNMSGLYEVI